MTQNEKKKLCKNVVEILQQGGYIKGYGDKKRVMTHDHSPMMNITAQIHSLLHLNSLLKKSEMIEVWSKKPFPETSFIFAQPN